MFSTTFSPLPHMMAHASSAGAPFDSEVSTADLDSEAFATTPSAASPTTTSNTTTTTSATTTTTTIQQPEAMDLDILSKLLDTSASSTEKNCVSDTLSLFSDPSVIATATTTTAATSSPSWSPSPSISPLALKLESPLLTHLADPESSCNPEMTVMEKDVNAKPKAKPRSTGPRKRSNDPADKEARARERVLRNRAAAQESRDKKRKYVSEIEASNEILQQENTQLLKRLKTVESDNLALSQRLEELTAQFNQMQQLLSQSIKQNQQQQQQGVSFCQSAALAKKDMKPSSHTGILTNSPQQRLAPPKEKLYTISDNHNRPQNYSMTMKNLMMEKKEYLKREAHWHDQSAARNWMEISCRSSTLTLSSSAAASFPTMCPSTRQQHLVLLAFLIQLLPQLMLNFSTLFLISTGARLSNPQELQLQQAILFFIQQLSNLQQQSNLMKETPILETRTIKHFITSLDSSAIEEIVTEFRQGRRDAARGLLVKALLSTRLNYDNDKNMKEKFLF